MKEDKLLELYSPIQVDIIDRDAPGHPIPLQAAAPERKQEYLNRIMRAFGELQVQEDARSAFADPEAIWSEVSEKISSFTRSVCVICGRPYGVYSCRSSEKLDLEEIESLKWYCRELWERGWGEGYAHCPREGPSLGLYIHFWQDDGAPLLTRQQWEAVQNTEQSRPPVTEINPDTFWTLLSQATDFCGENQKVFSYWLTEQLLTLGPEQALNFHSILHGYLELADNFGLWTAATLMQADDCCSYDEFEDFRAWLIAQGKDTYLAALADPDSLADVSDSGNYQFPSLPYVGDAAYERLTDRAAHADIDPDDHLRLVAELQKEIVYSAGIEFPYEWMEIPTYLPRLTAKHTSPEELRAYARRGRLWNHDDPAVQKARTAQKKRKSQKKKGGDAR